MNEYSLIIMRETDLKKLYQVKKNALKAIVDKGYHGATISYIAKQAGVSDGYLYRHYSNKNELVIELFKETMGYFHTLIFELINTETKISEILKKSFQFLADTSAETPEITAFIFIMDHDHNFDFPNEIKENFVKIGQQIWAKGIQTGEINNKRNVEDVLTITFGVPVKMLEMRRKGIISDKPLSLSDIENMVEMCLKALK